MVRQYAGRGVWSVKSRLGHLSGYREILWGETRSTCDAGTLRFKVSVGVWRTSFKRRNRHSRVSGDETLPKREKDVDAGRTTVLVCGFLKVYWKPFPTRAHILVLFVSCAAHNSVITQNQSRERHSDFAGCPDSHSDTAVCESLAAQGARL
jgi:hypothetical protein